MSRVSVIVPAFRAESHIGRAVGSVLAQRHSDWELLLVSDDGHDYRRLLQARGIRDGRIRFLDSGGHGRGPATARNVALAAARGELVAPLDADDLFYPTRLERLVPLAERHGMSGDNLWVVQDPSGHRLRTAFPEDEALRWLDLPGYARTDVPMSFVFSRRVLPRGWPAVDLGEDTLFNLTALEQVGQVPLVGEPLHEYRVRPGSLCHADDSHRRAERGYRQALAALAGTGLGLASAPGRRHAREMLERKRALNRRYTRALAAGRVRDFQEFVAGGGEQEHAE